MQISYRVANINNDFSVRKQSHSKHVMLLILWIDGDLSTREHSFLFDNEETEASFMLEAVDDNIAENDEIFIIYTSVIEDPEDNCARAVLLRDNDSEKN